MIGGSVDVEVAAVIAIVDVAGAGVLVGAVIGLVVDGSRAVDVGAEVAVDVDVESGGSAVRPAHAATVRNAASAHARNLMEQYYYDASPFRRGETAS